MGSEMLKTLYMDGSIMIAESEDGVFLPVGEQIYSLTSHAYEPCLYIQSEDKSLITIHDAITVEDNRSMAESSHTSYRRRICVLRKLKMFAGLASAETYVRIIN